MSLRQRLIAGGAAVVVILLIGGFLSVRAFQRHLVGQVDRELQEAAARPIFDGRLGPQRSLSEYFIAVGRDVARLQVVESDLVRSDLSPPVVAPEQVAAHVRATSVPPTPFSAQSQDGRTRWRMVAFRTRGGVGVIGAPLTGVEGTLGRIRTVQAFVILAALAAIVLVGTWVLRLGVTPIEAMAVQADGIAAGHLSRRISHPPETTEAGRLGTALNSMLGRIENAFRAREASEAKLRRFASDASHELRTPLTSIRGYAELWRAGGLQGDEELADAMRRIEQEAARMGVMVEDLLLLARLDEDRPARREPVRLDLLVADAVRDARAVEPDRPLNAALEPVTVEGDEDQLRQVVANLMANVRVHTPPDAAVHLRTEVRDGTGVLEVADEGPGFEAAQASKVFDRFWRVDKARGRGSGGAGLGLSIVEAIVRAHGGEVGVESRPGEGAQFRVRLPVADSLPRPNGLPGSSQVADAQ
jgi:two-component system, OmpR family, sensor kinase